MNSIEEAIKKFPVEFQYTISGRAHTTPSEVNRVNHVALNAAISLEKWDNVREILELPEYQAPLHGVVYCLASYSDISKRNWCKICKLLDDGKIVEFTNVDE